jgi:hypothetical protein
MRNERLNEPVDINLWLDQAKAVGKPASTAVEWST